MRGLVVAAMIVVNFCLRADRFQAFAFLLHSKWTGFTLADCVFPAFIFLVGVSIGVANEGGAGLDRTLMKKVAARCGRLFVLGLILGNLLWLWMHDLSFAAGLRPLGVLQRIALCYFGAFVLYRLLKLGAVLGVAVAILLLYWPLTLMTLPDGTAAHLDIPGLNVVSCVDRVVLGRHRWVEGPTGYDPEGLLSTLPALAQCLLGAIAGRWLRTCAASRAGAGGLIAWGAAMTFAGILWAGSFPIVKDLWSSSFVLVSSGITLMLLAGTELAVGARSMPRSVMRFFSVFGVNAILAYVVQFLGLGVLVLPLTMRVYRGLASTLSAQLASLALAVLFMLAVWLPLYGLYRHDRLIRI